MKKTQPRLARLPKIKKLSSIVFVKTENISKSIFASADIERYR